MGGPVETGEALAEDAGGRTVVYCVVPRELVARLLEPLRRHFAEDPNVEVIVEQRGTERRSGTDRRARTDPPPAVERRRIRNPEGRRIGDRRAPTLTAKTPELPRRARRYADRLHFVERVAPGSLELEDRDTARLVIRHQAGEQEAVGELYVRYFDRVYGYLQLLVRNPHEAEDLAQQSFLHVLESLERYERRAAPFRSWLFTIVRNQALQHLRDQGRSELVEPEELQRHAEESAARMSDQADELASLDWVSDNDMVILIRRLSPLQRQVVVLRYTLDLSTAEIARVIGRSPEAVRQIQSRAQRYLRERLIAAGRGPTHRGRDGVRRRLREAPVLRKRRFAVGRMPVHRAMASERFTR